MSVNTRPNTKKNKNTQNTKLNTVSKHETEERRGRQS